MQERSERSIAAGQLTGLGVTNGGPTFPVQEADSGQVAPGGLYPTDSELPVVSVIGGPPATLGGYSPDPSQTPMVSTADDPMGLSYLKAPDGLRK